MDKQKEREKPQAKKHGPNQWRMNYKGIFGQAKTPELAYLRLVEVLHERLEMTKRRSSEVEDYNAAEIKELKLSIKKCKEEHKNDLYQNENKYYELLNDFRVQHEKLENFVAEKESAQALMKENCLLRNQTLELKAMIENMKKQ